MDKIENCANNKLVIGFIIFLILISVIYYLNYLGYFDDTVKTESLKIPENNYNDIIEKILQKQSKNLD